MKHNIVFKFIAIALCAASLMGAVSSAFGMFVLAESGLYTQDVEEAYEDFVTTHTQSLGGEIAQRYASMHLGGANTQLVDSVHGNYWSNRFFDMNLVGYVIRDEAGNELGAEPLGVEPVRSFTFDTGDFGSYIRVVSQMPEEEYYAANSPQLPEGVVTQNGEDYVYSAIPETGAEVYFIDVQHEDGSWGMGSPEEPLGVIVCQENGIVEFFGAEGINLLEDTVLITGIQFLSRDETSIYEAYSPHGVLSEGRYDGSTTRLTMRLLTETASIMDAIPPEGCYVTRVSVTYEDDYSESTGGTPEIGFLDYEGGRVRFTPSNPESFSYRELPVTHIAFYDQNESLVYEARDPEGVGFFAYHGETLSFLSPSGTGEIPEETVSEETFTGYVNVNTNIYASSDLSSPVVGFLTSGCSVSIIPQEDGVWGWIPGSGWVLLEGITLVSAEESSGYAMDFPEEAAAMEETLFPEETGAVEVPVTTLEATIPEETVDPVQEETILTETEVSAAATEEGIFAEREASTAATEEVISAETEAVIAATEETIPGETEVSAATEGDVPYATEAVEAFLLDGELETTSGEVHTYGYWDQAAQQQMIVEYVYEPMPAYTVELRLGEGAIRTESNWVLARLLYAYRDQLPYLLGICLLLFAVLAVYLCCAAGRKPGTNVVRFEGLNRLPLDLYALITVGGVVLAAALVVGGTQYLMESSIRVGLLFAGLVVYAACLLVVGFCFACAAQFKTPGLWWWRHSVCFLSLKFVGFLCRKLLQLIKWLTKKCETGLWPWLVRLCKGTVKVVAALLKIGGIWLEKLLAWLQKGGDWLWNRMTRFFSLLPLTWQWLMAGFAMFLLVAIVFATNGEELLIVLSIGICIGLILYGAHCFGTLLEGVKHMRKGDLDAKVDDRLMVGAFRDFAGELNGLADVAVVAAQKQMKSERMKTELITNVSHDIKTPLTSIINYVDLLQKPHTEAEAEKYLEVLDRQSQRLKKLIDDLMEMSKASTGNLTVDVTRVDAAEAVNQALGEFSDKLERAQLFPVFRQPEEAVYMMADGRLVWRVMSNLLSNAVKYALPGTRVYVDLQRLENKVIISMKNISREELNVEADELMERFVRGDASRNTEGSGLGLNIAQSLMELQKGQLQILVDGDLFKVTLIFPGAE